MNFIRRLLRFLTGRRLVKRERNYPYSEPTSFIEWVDQLNKKYRVDTRRNNQ